MVDGHASESVPSVGTDGTSAILALPTGVVLDKLNELKLFSKKLSYNWIVEHNIYIMDLDALDFV